MAVPPYLCNSNLPEEPDLDDPVVKSAKRRVQFSVRTLLLAVAAVAILLATAVTFREWQKPKFMKPVRDYSWMSAQFSVQVEVIGGRTYVSLDGDWPDAKPSYRIRYCFSLIDEKGHQRMAEASTGGKYVFQREFFCNSVPPSGVEMPFRAVFDYEIWDGEPGSGTLLCKGSAMSEPIREVPAGHPSDDANAGK